MKRILALCLVLATGCMTGNYPNAPVISGPRPSIWRQDVVVELTNNCAPILHVMDGDNVRLVLRGTGTHYFRLERQPFSGQYGTNLPVTIKAYMFAGEKGYLGSASQSWSVDSYHSGYRVPWQFDRLQSPPNAQCKM